MVNLRYIWAWLFWQHGQFMFSNALYKKGEYLNRVESECKVIIREKILDDKSGSLYKVFYKL